MIDRPMPCRPEAAESKSRAVIFDGERGLSGDRGEANHDHRPASVLHGVPDRFLGDVEVLRRPSCLNEYGANGAKAAVDKVHFACRFRGELRERMHKAFLIHVHGMQASRNLAGQVDALFDEFHEFCCIAGFARSARKAFSLKPCVPPAPLRRDASTEVVTEVSCQWRVAPFGET